MNPAKRYDNTYSCKLSRKDMNMKKVSLLTLILSATTANWASAADNTPGTPPANCQKAFEGFHLGGNLGYGVGVGNQKVSLDQGNGSSESTSNRLGVRGVDGGVGVGYTKRFGNFALGLAFDANWTGVSGSHTDTDVIGATATQGATTSQTSLKARLRNSLQLYARMGYVIGGQAMPFIKLGWSNDQWRHKATISTTGEDSISAKKSKRLNGFLWGLGVDFLAWKHVVVGFEYTGTIAGKEKFKSSDGDLTGKFKPQYNRFALTAKIVY
jgi:opacity protein-like surface antigen